jgi:hypothetical protein
MDSELAACVSFYPVLARDFFSVSLFCMKNRACCSSAFFVWDCYLAGFGFRKTFPDDLVPGFVVAQCQSHIFNSAKPAIMCDSREDSNAVSDPKT